MYVQIITGDTEHRLTANINEEIRNQASQNRVCEIQYVAPVFSPTEQSLIYSAMVIAKPGHSLD